MKIFAIAIATAAAAIGVLSTAAKAENAREYYYAKMELHCAQTNHGAKWIGVGTGAIPVPVIGALIPAIITEECDQHAINKAASELARFRREHPRVVRNYERKYGDGGVVSYGSSVVTTSSGGKSKGGNPCWAAWGDKDGCPAN